MFEISNHQQHVSHSLNHLLRCRCRSWSPCCSIENGETQRNAHKHHTKTAGTQSTSTTRLSLFTCGRFVHAFTFADVSVCGFVAVRLTCDSHQVEKKRFNLSRTLNKPPCTSTHCHAYEREVILHGHLEPGHYLLIPSTYQPGAEARFLIRVFSSSSSSISLR